jgi:hypothetical protein
MITDFLGAGSQNSVRAILLERTSMKRLVAAVSAGTKTGEPNHDGRMLPESALARL